MAETLHNAKAKLDAAVIGKDYADKKLIEMKRDFALVEKYSDHFEYSDVENARETVKDAIAATYTASEHLKNCTAVYELAVANAFMDKIK